MNFYNIQLLSTTTICQETAAIFGSISWSLYTCLSVCVIQLISFHIILYKTLLKGSFVVVIPNQTNVLYKRKFQLKGKKKKKLSSCQFHQHVYCSFYVRSEKRKSSYQRLFGLLGSARKKSCSKMLVKLTPKVGSSEMSPQSEFICKVSSQISFLELVV